MNEFLIKFRPFSIFFFFILILISCEDGGYHSIQDWNDEVAQAQFVGSESCKECHQKEYDEWQQSHHYKSMEVADSTTILGNFDNKTIEFNGIKYKFFKKGKQYFVHTEGENNTYSDFEIKYTFGFIPLQQYLIAFPNGKLQTLLVAWNDKQKQWYHLQPNMKVHHPDWMHWTGGSMNWNNMCADCHSTLLKKNYETTHQSYHTTYSIINVSCESCHGPQSVHLKFYKNLNKYSNSVPPPQYLSKKTPAKDLVDKCARCHARRSQLTEYFNYQGHFLDHYDPSLLEYPTYEYDGQFKDEDYEFASFTQSKMYHFNVSCRDCHHMHTMQLKKRGNDLCLSCHLPKYNTYNHHFHKENTDASQCINCHMTGKNYMGIDFRRDHSFRVPRPDQSVKYGTPNACNGCHKDQSSKWAAEVVVKNYGVKRPAHFSDELLVGYFEKPETLLHFVANLNHPDIVRASALNYWSNNHLNEREIKEVLKFFTDKSPLVRNQAVLTIGKFKNADYSNEVKPLLQDSLRLVRLSAFRYFVMNNKDQSEMSSVQKEYEIYLRVNADFASGQHQLALIRQIKGDIAGAFQSYKEALKIDDHYNMSRMNMALLYYQNGKIKEAEDAYLKVIQQEPDYATAYYMLGLLYNETSDLKSSLRYLEISTQKDPNNIRAIYNYSLMLQKIGEYRKSLKMIENALKKSANQEDLLYLKLLALIELNENSQAIQVCENLIRLQPQNVNYNNLYRQLKGNTF